MNRDPVLSGKICVPAGAPVERGKTPEVWPAMLKGRILLQQSSLGREGNESPHILPSSGGPAGASESHQEGSILPKHPFYLKQKPNNRKR